MNETSAQHYFRKLHAQYSESSENDWLYTTFPPTYSFSPPQTWLFHSRPFYSSLSPTADVHTAMTYTTCPRAARTSRVAQILPFALRIFFRKSMTQQHYPRHPDLFLFIALTFYYQQIFHQFSLRIKLTTGVRSLCSCISQSPVRRILILSGAWS